MSTQSLLAERLLSSASMGNDSRGSKMARVATVAVATTAWIPNTDLHAQTHEEDAATHARDAILLIGDVRLQRVLGLIAAPRVFSAAHPLDAICILEREASGLHTVAASTELPWTAELREFLAAEHPAMRLILVTPSR
jgi:hypothetical protein